MLWAPPLFTMLRIDMTGQTQVVRCTSLPTVTVGAPSAVFNVFIEQCDAVFPKWQPPYGELLLALL